MTLIALLLIALLMACTPSAPDAADAGSVPPARPELSALHDSIRVAGLDDRRFSPDEYWSVMDPLTEAAGVEREEAGRSGEGRPLVHLTLGQGPTTVLLWSQMHGDESTASMALADLLAFLGNRPDHPAAREILEGTTLHMIPMLNPDGAARFQRRNAQGVDVNRDARRLQTPEGQTLKAVRDEVEPDFAFNLHDQNPTTRLGDTDGPVAIALLAPAFDSTGAVNEVRARAIGVAGVIVRAIEPVVGDAIARYDDTFNPRAFGDLVTAWGSSAVLIESGGWPDDPQKQHLRRANFVALVAALQAIATGSYEGVEPTLYDDLPENGRRPGHLLVRGGLLAPPDVPALQADVMISFDRPLLAEGGTIVDVGDLGGSESLDTLDASGLTLVPFGDALDDAGGIRLGGGAFIRAYRGGAEGDGELVWEMHGAVPDTLR